MRKIIFIFTFLSLFVLSADAEDGCATGYACSLDDMKKQENQRTEQNQQNIEKSKDKQKEEKKDGVFVDGGKYNKPEYTEMFTKYDLIP